MTESEWLACTDPEVLMWILWHLARRGTYCPSDRKLSLIACACCRERDPGGPPHGAACHAVAASRLAVEAAERYADGLASREELEGASTAARRAGLSMWMGDGRSPRPLQEAGREVATFALLAGKLSFRLRGDSWFPAEDAVKFDRSGPARVVPARQEKQVGFLRCVVGNPFRPIFLDPAWLTPAVLNLAQAAYDNRTLPAGTLEPARLAGLADALEEAGCTEADLLGHLRGPGPHVRGCWAVDLLLGKS
jgi:hypothetical protein